jgi:hypothetical protein
MIFLDCIIYSSRSEYLHERRVDQVGQMTEGGSGGYAVRTGGTVQSRQSATQMVQSKSTMWQMRVDSPVATDHSAQRDHRRGSLLRSPASTRTAAQKSVERAGATTPQPFQPRGVGTETEGGPLDFPPPTAHRRPATGFAISISAHVPWRGVWRPRRTKKLDDVALLPQRAPTADGHAAAEPRRCLRHRRWCFL